MTVLRVENLGKAFGGLRVTNDVSLSLSAGERLALIGPNGAGKTTLVNQIAGFLHPDSGAIYLHDRPVTMWPAHARVKAGLVRTFQISKLAPALPALEQVVMAIHQREGSLGHMWRHRLAYPVLVEEAEAILRDLQLLRLADVTPVSMAYGDQRLLEIALALALRPKVLLLDEPMAGVPRSEAQLILDSLERLPGDLAVIIIEHDMDLVFRFADRIIVLANGAVLAEGSPDSIRHNELVRSVYLGKTELA